MSTATKSRSDKVPYERPALEVAGPNRRTGGFYRTADGDGATLGGVPLVTAEAAVVAAVRLGYKVAAAQIDRSARLAQRLREAGDRAAGPESDRQALEAAEGLVFKSMMAGLSWLEGAAADPGHPLKRLAVAEYRLLGSLLGLTPHEATESAQQQASQGPSPAARDASAAPTRRASAAPLRIVLRGNERRAVRVVAYEMEANVAPGQLPMTFYSTQVPDPAPLSGELLLPAKGPATLHVTTLKESPSGPWRAAVCAADGEQLGIIEIVL